MVIFIGVFNVSLIIVSHGKYNRISYRSLYQPLINLQLAIVVVAVSELPLPAKIFLSKYTEFIMAYKVIISLCRTM